MYTYREGEGEGEGEGVGEGEREREREREKAAHVTGRARYGRSTGNLGATDYGGYGHYGHAYGRYGLQAGVSWPPTGSYAHSRVPTVTLRATGPTGATGIYGRYGHLRAYRP